MISLFFYFNPRSRNVLFLRILRGVRLVINQSNYMLRGCVVNSDKSTDNTHSNWLFQYVVWSSILWAVEYHTLLQPPSFMYWLIFWFIFFIIPLFKTQFMKKRRNNRVVHVLMIESIFLFFPSHPSIWVCKIGRELQLH